MQYIEAHMHDTHPHPACIYTPAQATKELPLYTTKLFLCIGKQ